MASSLHLDCFGYWPDTNVILFVQCSQFTGYSILSGTRRFHLGKRKAPYTWHTLFTLVLFLMGWTTTPISPIARDYIVYATGQPMPHWVTHSEIFPYQFSQCLQKWQFLMY